MTLNEILKKGSDLEVLGLINYDLFEVTGELARRYNEVLEKVFGFKSELDRFRIDKRGLSLEVGRHLQERYPERLEYPENYLNIRSANRYMIVVSPDQKSAPLIAPQTSYDNELCDLVHYQARHTIEDVTQEEALFGEMEDHVDIYTNALDLLHVKVVDVNLETLKKTVSAAGELEKLSIDLDKDDNALNSEYVSKMQGLVKQVGDIRYRMIAPRIFPITRELHCFYVEFFNGIHCLRNFKNSDGTRGIFVHNKQEIPEENSDISIYDLHDKNLVGALYKYKFIKFNPLLLEIRIREVEDQALLSQGIDVIKMNPQERKSYINEKREILPKLWSELRTLHRMEGHSSKTSMQEAIESASYEARVKLAEGIPNKKLEIVEHLLSDLDLSDPIRMYNYNRQRLVHEFPFMQENRKCYIASKLLENKGGKE